MFFSSVYECQKHDEITSVMGIIQSSVNQLYQDANAFGSPGSWELTYTIALFFFWEWSSLLLSFLPLFFFVLL